MLKARARHAVNRVDRVRAQRNVIGTRARHAYVGLDSERCLSGTSSSSAADEMIKRAKWKLAAARFAMPLPFAECTSYAAYAVAMASELHTVTLHERQTFTLAWTDRPQRIPSRCSRGAHARPSLPTLPRSCSLPSNLPAAAVAQC